MSNFTLAILLFLVAGREVLSTGHMVWKSVKALATARTPVPNAKAEDFATRLIATTAFSIAVTTFCVLAGMRLS